MEWSEQKLNCRDETKKGTKRQQRICKSQECQKRKKEMEPTAGGTLGPTHDLNNMLWVCVLVGITQQR